MIFLSQENGKPHQNPRGIYVINPREQKKVAIVKLVVTGSIFKLFPLFKCLKGRGRSQLFDNVTDFTRKSIVIEILEF